MKKHTPKPLAPEVLARMRYERIHPPSWNTTRKTRRPSRTYRGRRRNDARMDLCFGLKAERYSMGLTYPAKDGKRNGRAEYDALRRGKTGCYAEE